LTSSRVTEPDSISTRRKRAAARVDLPEKGEGKG
jgi:hypothetical protein